MSTPQAHPFLDLDRYKDTLIDPSLYFVDTQTAVPRVVLHASGQPQWIIDNSGTLRPWADYVAKEIPPSELPDHTPQPHVYTFGPRPAPTGIVVQAAPGKVAAAIIVK